MHSTFSFKNYVSHFEINIRIQNRIFAFKIISVLDHSHISMEKHKPTFKFSIHRLTFRFSNKVLASTFILSGLTITILQWRAIPLWNWGLCFYEIPKKTRRHARHSFWIQHWSFQLNFTGHAQGQAVRHVHWEPNPNALMEDLPYRRSTWLSVWNKMSNNSQREMLHQVAEQFLSMANDGKLCLFTLYI